MFIVIKSFADLQDDRYIYNVGDVFPREGKKVSLKRQQELLGSKNRIGKPLIIEKITEPKEEPKEEAKEEPKPQKNK